MNTPGDRMDLYRSPGYLVHDVGRLWGKRFDQRARGLGLSRAQCKALAHLARSEGINQAGLADLLEVEPMTLVRLLDRMEEAGWIERRPDPADRRARRLFLGEKAKPVFEAIWQLAEATRAESLAGLSATEQALLIDLLLRIHGNLSSLAPLAGDPRGGEGESRPRKAASAR
jgi:DNA-binding MarR family transcriptional regulator